MSLSPSPSLCWSPASSLQATRLWPYHLPAGAQRTHAPLSGGGERAQAQGSPLIGRALGHVPFPSQSLQPGARTGLVGT